MEGEIQSTKTVAVSQRKGSCGIHQTVMTTLVQTYPTDDQKLRALIEDALCEIDDGDYSSVAAQVGAMEAVVAQVKQIDDAMALDKNRVEKLVKELAELKRELERYRQERRGMTTAALRMVSAGAGALLPDGIKSKLRCARDLFNLILGDD